MVATAGYAGQQGPFAVTACGKGVVLSAVPLSQPPPQYAAAMAARGALTFLNRCGVRDG